MSPVCRQAFGVMLWHLLDDPRNGVGEITIMGRFASLGDVPVGYFSGTQWE